MADSRNVAQVGEWKTWNELIDELDPGDLIEVQRGRIQHWAVFVEAIDGKGIIVHVNGDVLTGIGAVIRSRTLADIRVEDLGAIVGDCQVRVNNSTDHMYEPVGPGAAVVRRGLSKLGQHSYDVFNYNCEHWANWCRNANTVSMQVDSMTARMAEYRARPATKYAELKSKWTDKCDEWREKVDTKCETLRSNASDSFDDLKSKWDDKVKTPRRIDIPPDMMEKLPFLRKFQDVSVDGAKEDEGEPEPEGGGGETVLVPTS